MKNLFDDLFGDATRPFRRDADVRATFDGEGNAVLEPIQAESATLSPEGSLDRIKISRDRFYHCGCSAQLPIGNQCGEFGCNRISCVNCAGRCRECSKPICLEHTRFLTDEEGARISMCASCCGKVARKAFRRTLFGLLLSPFISKEY